ncbi:MAG TPA: hypothetical protein VGT44_16675 [Ktedonobacteraceae bacterium]|nr:hypothetical protein [Ktedonobacteraceae bacterium]
MKYYYTAQEARQQLGVNVGAFYYLVDTGKIKKVTPPGKKQGFYSRHQIERLAQEEATGLVADKHAGLIFKQATLDDLAEEYELALLTLNGSAGYGLPAYETWLRKNAATNFLVRDHGRLVAFMHVLPVTQGCIQRWIKGEIREWEIEAEDVQPYASQRTVECLITCMVTTPDVGERERRLYGMRLIHGYLQFIHHLARLGITISRYYAAGSSTEVIDMLKRAKFEHSGQVGKRTAFELNPLTAKTHMAKHYRAILKRHNLRVEAR